MSSLPKIVFSWRTAKYQKSGHYCEQTNTRIGLIYNLVKKKKNLKSLPLVPLVLKLVTTPSQLIGLVYNLVKKKNNLKSVPLVPSIPAVPAVLKLVTKLSKVIGP